MIASAEARGVQFIVGQSQSYEPPIRAIRELVRSGEIGPLGMISGGMVMGGLCQYHTAEVAPDL